MEKIAKWKILTKAVILFLEEKSFYINCFCDCVKKIGCASAQISSFCPKMTKKAQKFAKTGPTFHKFYGAKIGSSRGTIFSARLLLELLKIEKLNQICKIALF